MVIEKIKEVIVPGPERIVERRIHVVPPPEVKIKPEIVGKWTGVWKSRYPLPMFDIKQFGFAYEGWCTPNATGVYPIKDGNVREGNLEFSVSDEKYCRIQFRMIPLPNGDARIISWIKPEDVIVMFAKLKKEVRTPQQEVAFQLLLRQEIDKLGKYIVLGVFRRVVDIGTLTGEDAKGAPRAKNGQRKSTQRNGG